MDAYQRRTSEGNASESSFLSLSNAFLMITLRRKTKGGFYSLVDPQTGLNFIAPSPQPLYRLILVEPGGPEVELTSMDAEAFEVQETVSPEKSEITLTYGTHKGLDIHVSCRVSLDADSSMSHWRISVRNNTTYGIRTIHYPVVVTPSRLDEAEEDFFLDPGSRLMRNPHLHDIRPRDPLEWKPTHQYPGPRSMQFSVFYNRVAGLYMAAYDGTGCVKDLGVFRLNDDFDHSIAHHFDEQAGLDFEVPYDTVLGVFHGDWYDAADIYKAWAYRQPWCARKLTDREDVPDWIKEPRLELMTIIQGGQERIHGLQTTPGEYPIGRFFPAYRAVALQKEYARIFGAPILSWMEGWEKIGAPGGPVEIFPPREGEESYKAAMADLVQEDHIPLMYLAGFHWCYKRPQIGYDDWPRFEREGRQMATLDKQGELMISNNHTHMYAMGQKHYATLCTGSKDLQSLFLENFHRMMDVGAVAVQLDQQGGMLANICYSDQHDHPPGYGSWMTEKTGEFIRTIRGSVKERNPDATFSNEGPCEFWIQDIDFFLDRPYHYDGKEIVVPLFQYIYHEYAICYSGDGIVNILHPEASLILHAKVFTLGLLNTVAYGEEEYNIEVDPDYPVLTLLRNICRAQRTFARNYVVFGQMQKPIPLEVDYVEADGFRGEPWEVMIPRVYHNHWKGPDGRFGTLLANWGDRTEEVILTLDEAMEPVAIRNGQGNTPVAGDIVRGGRIPVRIPPRDVALVEQGTVD